MGTGYERYFDDNRRLWDARTRVHVNAYSDVAVVRDGGLSLGPPDTDEIGDVAGKDLLHLQCHFGLDTISWARLGAHAVGLDFSPEAIRTAASLAAELGVDAEFVEANVYDLPGALPRTFDVVVTSHGVLWWLPDLTRWGEVVAAMLRPGGTFYICELHPLAMALRERDGVLVLGADYFGSGEPLSDETDRTYIDADVVVERHMEHGWIHTLADVVNALADAGLRIEFLHEHPFAAFPMFPSLVRAHDGYRPPPPHPSIPLLFSIRAGKPGA